MPELLRDDVPAALPARLAGLRRPYYLHQTPAWMLRALLGVVGLVVAAGLVLTGWRLSAGRAGLDVWVMGACLAGCAALLLRPSTWRPPIAMAADEQGMHFFGSNDAQPPVFVPWQQTGAITIERRSGARTVVVTIDDASPYWAAAKRSRFLGPLLAAPDANGRRPAPLGPVGLSPEKSREALDALRRRALR